MVCIRISLAIKGMVSQDLQDPYHEVLYGKF